MQCAIHLLLRYTTFENKYHKIQNNTNLHPSFSLTSQGDYLECTHLKFKGNWPILSKLHLSSYYNNFNPVNRSVILLPFFIQIDSLSIIQTTSGDTARWFISLFKKQLFMPVPEQKSFRETNELKWDNGHVMECLHYGFYKFCLHGWSARNDHKDLWMIVPLACE